MTNDFTQHNEQQNEQPYDINWNRPSFKPNIGFYLEKLIYMYIYIYSFKSKQVPTIDNIYFRANCIFFSPLTPSPILLLSLINLTLLLLLSSSLLPSSFN
jgi:hypothetical protein